MSKKPKNNRLDAQNDGLVVERRVDKKPSKEPRKKQERQRVELPHLSLDYTKKARAFARRFGRTAFFVSGKNGARVLGALSKVCSVKNVAFASDGVTFDIPSKHRGQIIALLNNLCYDYKIIGVKGTLPLAVSAVTRLGFAAGLIAVLTAVCIFPQFVTRVSVRTADGSYEQTIDSALNASIESILTSHGVRTGRWLPKLDIDSVEKSLLALDGVSYASVQRHGTHIDVRIKQEQPNDYLVEVYGSEVKSKKVAVVTRVIVEGGTAAVKYGDVVKVGDTLIDGYTMFGDDKLEVEAKGIVYGKVYYKKTVFFADTYTERVYGATKSVTKLSMFGKTPKLPKSPFEKYELETSVDNLGFLLPFKIYTYRFRELAEIERQNELTVDEMYAQIYSQIVAGFEEPIRVLDRYESVREADGGKYVTVTVEAEERIS